jgi:hypothetical protein
MQQNSDINKVCKLIYDLSDVILTNNGFIVYRENKNGDFTIEYKTLNNGSYLLNVHVANYSVYEYYFSITLICDNRSAKFFLLTINIGLVKTTIHIDNVTSDIDINYSDFIKEPVFFIKNVIELFISNLNNFIVKNTICYRITNSDFVIRDEKLKKLIND